MSKLSFLYFTAADSETTAVVNWVNPGQFSLSGVSAPVFTAWQGYVGDGSADYLDTGITPLGLPNYERDYSHVGAYMTRNAAGAVGVGLSGSSSIILQPRTGGGNFSSRHNQATGHNVANADSDGYFLLNRETSTSYAKYIDNSLAATATETSDTLSSADTFTLLHANGNFSAAGGKISVAHAGLFLDSTRRSALSAIITRYMSEASGF